MQAAEAEVVRMSTRGINYTSALDLVYHKSVVLKTVAQAFLLYFGCLNISLSFATFE